MTPSEKEPQSSFELSEEQIKILDEELAAYSENPEEGESWEVVRNRIILGSYPE